MSGLVKVANSHRVKVHALSGVNLDTTNREVRDGKTYIETATPETASSENFSFPYSCLARTVSNRLVHSD